MDCASGFNQNIIQDSENNQYQRSNESMSEDKDSESSSDSGSADPSSDSCQFSDIEEFS